MEKRVHHGIKARTEMYADFMYQVRLFGFNEFTKSKYIYVIVPTDDDEDLQWEGAVTTIRKYINKYGDKQ